MQVQPQHHDGEGTNASLNDFLNGGRSAPRPSVDLREYVDQSINWQGDPLPFTHAPASRDIGVTVQRLRDRGIEPPRVDAPLPNRTNTAILVAANVLILWVAITLIRAWWDGRL